MLGIWPRCGYESTCIHDLLGDKVVRTIAFQRPCHCDLVGSDARIGARAAFNVTLADSRHCVITFHGHHASLTIEVISEDSDADMIVYLRDRRLHRRSLFVALAARFFLRCARACLRFALSSVLHCAALVPCLTARLSSPLSLQSPYNAVRSCIEDHCMSHRCFILARLGEIGGRDDFHQAANLVARSLAEQGRFVARPSSSLSLIERRRGFIAFRAWRL